MAYSRQTSTHSSGDAVTAQHLDDEFNYLYNTVLAEGIGTSELTDGEVTADKLASNAVTTAKILNANVTAAKLASNAVETAKIKDDAVTVAKIADQTLDNVFGSWTNQDAATNAIVKDSVYKPSSDGFVCAIIGGTASVMIGRTDSSNPPTTVRCQTRRDYNTESFTMPVRKNDYFKITATVGTPTIYWLPIGGGTCTKQ